MTVGLCSLCYNTTKVSTCKYCKQMFCKPCTLGRLTHGDIIICTCNIIVGKRVETPSDINCTCGSLIKNNEKSIKRHLKSRKHLKK